MAELLRDSFHGSDPADAAASFHEESGAVGIEFYWNPVTERDYCKIVFPGDRQKVWDQPVREVDKQRYHRQWTLYKEGKDQNAGQTMLKTWGAIDPGSIEIYQSLHIQTVEQLAALSDQNMANMPPGHTGLAYRHRDMAKAFLHEKQQSIGFDKAMQAASEATAVAQAATAENEQLRGQMAELMERIEREKTQRAEVVAAVPQETEFPQFVDGHGRGSRYRLSDGSLVVGKKAAIQAQNALN